MRPITVTVPAGASNSNVIPLDHYISPFNVSLAFTTANATNLSFIVQSTYADVWNSAFEAETATWFTTPMSASNASATGNIAFPVTAVRLQVSAADFGSSLTVIQAGLVGG